MGGYAIDEMEGVLVHKRHPVFLHRSAISVFKVKDAVRREKRRALEVLWIPEPEKQGHHGGLAAAFVLRVIDHEDKVPAEQEAARVDIRLGARKRVFMGNVDNNEMTPRCLEDYRVENAMAFLGREEFGKVLEDVPAHVERAQAVDKVSLPVVEKHGGVVWVHAITKPRVVNPAGLGQEGCARERLDQHPLRLGQLFLSLVPP